MNISLKILLGRKINQHICKLTHKIILIFNYYNESNLHRIEKFTL